MKKKKKAETVIILIIEASGTVMNKLIRPMAQTA
jgi:hypothetical protein